MKFFRKLLNLIPCYRRLNRKLAAIDNEIEQLKAHNRLLTAKMAAQVEREDNKARNRRTDVQQS